MISFYKNRLQCLLWIIQSYIYTVSENSCFQVDVLKCIFQCWVHHSIAVEAEITDLLKPHEIKPTLEIFNPEEGEDT